MKTKSKIKSNDYLKRIGNYMLAQIYFENELDHCNNFSNLDKFRKIHEIFLSEYEHEIKRTSIQKAFENWLRGLPTNFTIAFYNHDILLLHKKLTVTVKNLTEKEEDKILENYWNLMAFKFFSILRHLEKNEKFLEEKLK